MKYQHIVFDIDGECDCKIGFLGHTTSKYYT